METIVFPVVRGMAIEKTPYLGVLYVGLMLTEQGPRVIEFNCRFGDPEAEVILPRLKSDIVGAMLATTTKSLGHFDMRWDDRVAVTVVMANKGYPGSYNNGSLIKNIAQADNGLDQLVFHSGTGQNEDGAIIAIGGRVLAVTALGETTATARSMAYNCLKKIDWPEGFFRNDIGLL